MVENERVLKLFLRPFVSSYNELNAFSSQIFCLPGDLHKSQGNATTYKLRIEMFSSSMNSCSL